MTIAEILTSNRVRLDVHAPSKKRALEALSELLAEAHPEITSRTVFDRLFARERLGSTGLGCGVALPHGRVPNLDRTVGAFIKIDGGIDYDSPDGEPVDLMFALLVPEECTEEHLNLLAELAGIFDDDELREALRHETSPRVVCETMGKRCAPRAA